MIPVLSLQGARLPTARSPKDYAIGDKAHSHPRPRRPPATGSPALTTANSGWIIAWDGRPSTCQDAPQANSIVYRISKDGGKSWTPIKTALAAVSRCRHRSATRSSFVKFDRTTGTVFLFSVKSYDAGLFSLSLAPTPRLGASCTPVVESPR